MKFLLSLLTWCVTTVAGLLPAVAWADVIVLANRSRAGVELRVALPGDKPQTYTLQPAQVVPVPVVEEATIDYDSGAGRRQHRIAANSIVYFFTKAAAPDVVEIAQHNFSADRPLPAKPRVATAAELARLRTIGIIPVKILVDDEEPAVKRIWQQRLKRRLSQASDVLEQCCLVRLQVVDSGMWDSQDGINDFRFSIREFEREVTPGPRAALAIGFSSQYDRPHGRVHMGGTRGPLHPYILIREWSQHVAYAQRVAIVVHELGHVLGAAHSPDEFSVMRPLVNKAIGRARAVKIGFDPLNTMAMYLLCEQLRLRGAVSLRQFSPRSRELLCRVYRQMQKQMPKDDSAKRYIALLQKAAEPLQSPLASGGRQTAQAAARLAARQNQRLGADPAVAADPAQAKTLVAATRIVLDAVLQAAGARQKRSWIVQAGSQSGDSPAEPIAAGNLQHQSPAGDRLTAYYVCSAARVADRLPPQLAAKAFLLGLAIGLDSSGDLQGHAALARLVGLIETDALRKRRLSVLGTPTMHGRDDLARHFMISAALTAMVGRDSARMIAIAKEKDDCRRLSENQSGGSGFSFRDLAADLAGICFARRLMAGKLRLADLGTTFCVDGFLPSVADLPEGLSSEQFESRFGSTADQRFQAQEAAIREEILALPGYVLIGR